jgi:hypothetical protein
MKVCPSCQYNNREGYLFCEECGQSLQDSYDVTLPTKEIAEITNSMYSRANWGTARFTRDAWIVLHVREASEPLLVRPGEELVLGRVDASSMVRPDVDLSPFGALEKGVSRIHAAICRNDDTLLLIDKDSSNGTHLNGQRLMVDQPRVLRDGDEIRLGRLVLHIYFRSDGAG